MEDKAAKLRNPADARVIDACVELLDAGRPLSEVINEAKRLSSLKTEGLPPGKSAEQPTIEQPTIEQPTIEQPTIEQPIAEPARATKKLPLTWPIAAAILLAVAIGTAETVYLPRTMAETSVAGPASSIPAASLPPVLSPITTTKHNPAPASDTAAEIKMLVERGNMFVGSGDLASAREVYERAVDAGDARAAIYLGTTYDPSFLKRARFGKATRGDLETAAYWYRRAGGLGSSDAQALLKTIRK
jgi:hypothetical protein